MNIIKRIFFIIRLGRKANVNTTGPSHQSTALNEMLEWYLKNHQPLNQNEDRVVYKLRSLLEKERRQIEDAFYFGATQNTTFENYYTQYYGKH